MTYIHMQILLNLHNLCKNINKQYSIQININVGANFPIWKWKNGSSQNKLVIMQINKVA